MESTANQTMALPPGFRFHPTDEELITHYLCKKVINRSFSSVAIGEADLNKCEPWDLPWMAKIGEREWYFFCIRDRKYPTGLRTNRATDCGYWKATGKDKEIYRGRALVGMKKTLVFYRGRAPKGEKSNWVMHEYRLEGNLSLRRRAEEIEWVICRVYQKSAGGKKIPISALRRRNDPGGFTRALSAMISSPFSDGKSGSTQVPCFSTYGLDRRTRQSFDSSLLSTPWIWPYPLPFASASATRPHPSPVLAIDEARLFSALPETRGVDRRWSFRREGTFNADTSSVTPNAPPAFDPVWSFRTG